MEPPPGFEPGTPSLPWKCSATELRRRVFSCLSGSLPPCGWDPFLPMPCGFALRLAAHRCSATERRRHVFSCVDSASRLPHPYNATRAGRRIRTSEGDYQQIYSLLPLATWVSRQGCRSRTGALARIAGSTTERSAQTGEPPDSTWFFSSTITRIGWVGIPPSGTSS